jgi:hypothetical protein
VTAVGRGRVKTHAERANLDNPRTRRAYQIDLQDFMGFAGIRQPDEFQLVTRAHVLAWRKVLEARAIGRDDPAQARRAVVAVRIPV